MEAAPELIQANEQLLIAAVREQENAERSAQLAADLENALARETLLANASLALTSFRDYRDAIAKIPRLLVPALGDWCAIEMVQPTGELVPLGAAHVVAKGAATRPATARELDGGTIAAQVMRSGQPVLRIGVDSDAGTEGQRDLNTPRPVRTFLSVPVVTRGAVVALLSIATWAPRRELGADDLRFAEELARRVAVAIDNGRLYEEARVAVQMRDDVLATVSHDLMNPLMAIRVATARLLAGDSPSALPPDAVKSLDTINRAAERIKHLVAQMSDTASVHAGQLVLRMSQEDVGRLVREACDLVETIAATRSLRLRRSLPGSPLPAQCDAQRIFSVLENLLTNAIKFTPEGGTISVSAGLSDAKVVVAVEDDGPGIRDEEPGELFQPYRRGQGTTQPGKGLGLYIARGIVEAHGGTLDVDRDRTKGSRFVFTLPAAAGTGR